MWIDTHELEELSRQRQQGLIEWREQQRLLKSLPKQEPAAQRLSRQWVTAIIDKLESLGQPRTEAQPRVEQRRREA